jgi:catechol 2,3-dioxygenase-like lactoylglutathione lyase family enzyme
MRQIDTIILVADIERTRRFYEGLFALEVLHDWKSMVVYCNRLAFHQADLLFPQEALRGVLPGRLGTGNLVVYLESPDIEETFRDLLARDCEIVHGLVSTPWGTGRIFRIKDPDGHLVEIGELKPDQPSSITG